MPVLSLTDRSVSQFKPGADRVEIADAMLPGLYLIVQPSGHKSWAARFRAGRKSRKLTLGSYPVIGLALARDLARKALGKVADGADPQADKIAARDVDGSVEAAVAIYREQHLPTLRAGTRAYAERELSSMLAAWRGRALASIRKADVIALRDAAHKRGRSAAVTTQKRAVAFLAWSAERDMIPLNPGADLRQPSAVERDRVLSDAELAQVWKAADRAGRFGDYVKLLILTGCRKSEIGRLEWSEVTADAIELPPARTKTNVRHIVPLTDAMRRIIDGRPKGYRYVFGKTPVCAGGHAKEAITDRLAPGEVAPWTLHDLRRSFASGCARIGILPHVIERCLNHAAGHVAAIYNRYSYAAEKRDAFERWSKHVAKLVR